MCVWGASLTSIWPALSQEYFADAPQPLFQGRSYEEDMEKAKVGTR